MSFCEELNPFFSATKFIWNELENIPRINKTSHPWWTRKSRRSNQFDIPYLFKNWNKCWERKDRKYGSGRKICVANFYLKTSFSCKCFQKCVSSRGVKRRYHLLKGWHQDRYRKNTSAVSCIVIISIKCSFSLLLLVHITTFLLKAYSLLKRNDIMNYEETSSKFKADGILDFERSDTIFAADWWNSHVFVRGCIQILFPGRMQGGICDWFYGTQLRL